MEHFYVYIYRTPDGVPRYIGKGYGKRFKSHFTKSSNKGLRALVEFYGKSLSVEKVAENLREVDAFALEQRLITEYGREIDGGTLTNVSKGGSSGTYGRVIPPDERQRRKEAMSRPEVREKQRLSHLGKPSGRLGMKASAETIEKLRISHLGKTQDVAQIAKRVLKLRGKKRTPEYLAWISERRRGEKRSAETRANMSASARARMRTEEWQSTQAKARAGFAEYLNSDRYVTDKAAHRDRMKQWWADRKRQATALTQECSNSHA